MAPISLADVSITGATPGVLVKGTVDPFYPNAALLSVVRGDVSSLRIDDQINPSYIVDGETAYWSWLSYLPLP